MGATVSSTAKQAPKAKPTADRDAFDAEIRRRNLIGYWMIPSRSVGFREPEGIYAPMLWKWETLREMAYGAVDHIPKEEAYRRFIGLQHPELKIGTAPNYFLGCQLLKAGEHAPAHRHMMDAIRFVIEGDGVARTVINGEPFPMRKWDFMTTPNWTWHDHVNEGKNDSIWLDGAVSPLIRHFNVPFAEPFPEYNQPVTRPEGWSNRQTGPLRPRGALQPPRPNRAYCYPWNETSVALDILSEGEGDPHDDIVLHYADPATGGPTLPTLGCEIQRLRPRFSGRAHRHIHATTYHVLQGDGTTEIGGRTFEWTDGDTFVVPMWTWHRHRNDGAEPALLFSIDDLPVIRALGFDREEKEIK